MIKNIFFDFDGVIADSVNVKTEAFYNLYLPYGKKIAEEVVAHHKANGGMSRYEKFVLYHKKYLNVNLTSEQVGELAEKFSSLVIDGVINAPEVKGVNNFLKRNSVNFKMFIITGTPTDESIKICKARGIFHYFKGIYGSPQKKGYWCNYIIEQFSLLKDETIFIGDAFADYYAAKESNLTFYLREYAENKDLFMNIKDINRFRDFYEMQKLLGDLL